MYRLPFTLLKSFRMEKVPKKGDFFHYLDVINTLEMFF